MNSHMTLKKVKKINTLHLYESLKYTEPNTLHNLQNFKLSNGCF